MNDQPDELPQVAQAPAAPLSPSELDAKIAADRRLAQAFTSLGIEASMAPTPSPWVRITSSRFQPLLLPALIIVPALFILSTILVSVNHHNSKKALLASQNQKTADEKSIAGAASNLSTDGSSGGSAGDQNGDGDGSDSDTSNDVTADGGTNGDSGSSEDIASASDPGDLGDGTEISSDGTITEISDPGTVSGGSTGGTVTPPVTNPTAKVTKVLVFVEENHSLAQMKSGMPYAFALAKKYGYASNYVATTHPSLPNYIAIASGTTSGIQDDSGPSSHKLTGSSVFGKAIAAGKTAKLYADGMQSNCALANGGTKYAVKHNPWAYFVNERTSCNKYDVSMAKFRTDAGAGSFPVVGMVIPNLCNDAHDCSLATADNWFKSQMAAVFAGPDWKAGRLVVVLTADEDDRNSGNKVLTVVIHPSQKAKVVSSGLTHYSLSLLYSQVSRTTPLGNAAHAPSMVSAFRLPL